MSAADRSRSTSRLSTWRTPTPRASPPARERAATRRRRQARRRLVAELISRSQADLLLLSHETGPQSGYLCLAAGVWPRRCLWDSMARISPAGGERSCFLRGQEIEQVATVFA